MYNKIGLKGANRGSKALEARRVARDMQITRPLTGWRLELMDLMQTVQIIQ